MFVDENVYNKRQKICICGSNEHQRTNNKNCKLYKAKTNPETETIHEYQSPINNDTITSYQIPLIESDNNLHEQPDSHINLLGFYN